MKIQNSGQGKFKNVGFVCSLASVVGHKTNNGYAGGTPTRAKASNVQPGDKMFYQKYQIKIW